MKLLRIWNNMRVDFFFFCELSLWEYLDICTETQDKNTEEEQYVDCY